MNQAAQLDFVRSLELGNQEWLRWARGQAQTISLTRGSVTSDDVREVCARLWLQPDSPKSWGALWKAPGWVFLGREKSTWPSNHGRFIGRWQWVGRDSRAR